jgi:hypothetical protein
MAKTDLSFPSFTELGGYTIIYIDKVDVLCATCAKEYHEQTGEIPESDVYWEGPVIHCENCNAEIESSYGDPEENT